MGKEEITESIRRMYEVAGMHPDKKFMVAYRNEPDRMSLSGYSGREMIRMFLNAGPVPGNVIFNSVWREEMNVQLSKRQGQKV